MNNFIHYEPFDEPEKAAQLFLDFAERSDRDDPVKFVGREEQMGKLDRRLRNTRTAGKTLSNGLFMKGAPGAGKTAFLSEVGKRLSSRDTRVIQIEGDTLSTPLDFVAAFYDEAVHKTKHRATHRKFEIGSSGVSFGQEWADVRGYINKELAQGSSVWDAIRMLCGRDIDTTVCIVCVDEAQRILPDKGSDSNRIATQMHGGKTGRIKLLPIFSGLSDTPVKLKAAGISRESKHYESISNLSFEQAKAYVQAFFEEETLGMQERFVERDKRRIEREVAIASEGWPRHLHTYQDEIALAIGNDLLKSPPSNCIDLGRIIERGNERRIEYADSRLDSANLGRFERALIMALQRTDSHEIYSPDVEEYSLELGLNHTEIEVKLGEAIHCGVLQKTGARDGANLFGFPVPSFLTFMRNGKNREKTLQDMRIDIETKLTERKEREDT